MRLAASQIRSSDSQRVDEENKRYESIVKAFVKRGIPIDFPTAIALGDTPRAKQLLKEKPELAKASFADQPALHRALELDRREIVVAILDQGVDVNLKDDGGCTPLHWAAF